ncbi:MAG TPA: glycosyltransferase family 39 protein [Acidobacteriaceae bacterium]|nr:glycosyltransferase family 39 protein [Acidobacteriaceae bacterium]
MTATAAESSVKPEKRALPVLALYPLFFAAVFLGHLTLLHLPYFWDEGGYYIPAAMDFFHSGTLIPYTTATNAHPPLPSVLLAGVWSVTGCTIIATRTFVCMISAAALLAVYRLARNLLGELAAAAVALLTAIYPIWYVQSTLAHADIFAAAFTLWGLALYLAPALSSRPKRSAVERSQPFRSRTAATVAVLFALSALSKETAIITPFALALHRLYLAFRERENRRTHLLWIGALCFCILPLLAWYGYHHHKTGFTFGNPEFLRYNATANLDPHRIALSLYHRGLHLFGHMNMWVATLLTASCFILPRRLRPSIPTATLIPILITILANWIAFSILGGALLTRYLLPVYPLVLLLFVAVWRERSHRWPLLAALPAAAFLIALHIDPPYTFAPEDNLTYRDMIVLHQEATAFIEQHLPQATVLTAWPGNAELIHPELGYVHTPVKVTSLTNFALDQILKAQQTPGDYDAAFLFSTKYEPGRINISQHTENSDARYFDFHRDVHPEQAAGLLHGTIVWQDHRDGEWAAVLRFPRSYESQLATGNSKLAN